TKLTSNMKKHMFIILTLNFWFGLAQAQNSDNFLSQVEEFYKSNKKFEMKIHMTTVMKEKSKLHNQVSDITQLTDGFNYLHKSKEFTFLQTNDYLIKMDNQYSLIYVKKRAEGNNNSLLNISD